MFTVKDKFSWMSKNFIRDSDHAHGRILRPFFQICSNRVDGVAYEYRFNGAKRVIDIAERVYTVVRHQSESDAEDHGASDNSSSENSLFLCKHIVSNIRMHVEHESIERHALSFRDRT